MANENKPFCPLSAITRSCVCKCSGDRCVWWVSTPNGGGCALAVLAKAKAEDAKNALL